LIGENKAYHNRYRLYDPKTGSQFSDIIEVNTLELPKLPKEWENSTLWQWLKFLRAEKKEEFDMLAQSNPNIKKAVGILMDLSADEQTRMLYEARQEALWQEEARRRESLAEGEQKGRAEGHAEGLVEGEQKKAVEVAENLLRKNMPESDVAEAVGLSLAEVARLASKLAQ
jgi:predicted transposase/invertase (TIGR01784 family)